MSYKSNKRAVLKRLSRAAREGINVTMTQGVVEAKNNHHGWKNITTTAEKSIRIIEGAITTGRRTVGLWGSIGVIYFKNLENRYMTLRSAAEIAHPNLIRNIRKAFR